MTLPVKNYYHTQAGGVAPLSGTVGALIPILDACLVTGFNSKSVSSITVANNVATITTATNHNLAQGDNIAISGANEAVFNHEFFVASVPSSTTLTIAVVTATTPATGTITLKIPSLGWEKAFSGTNVAVYRSADVTGTRLYLRVNDAAATAATVAMYETMSNADTGTGKSADLYWAKSDAASSATRPWYLMGDSRRFYFFSSYASGLAISLGHGFGDLNSFKAGDAYSAFLIGATNSGNLYGTNHFAAVSGTTRTSGQLLARAYTQLGGTVGFYKQAPIAADAEFGYSTGLPAVNPSDNGIHLTPLYVLEAGTTNLRGTMPGLYAPLESMGGAAFVARDATLILNGKTYLALPTIGIAATAINYAGCCWVDATGPW